MEIIDFSTEIEYKTARSGGKGGQNVNKVETNVSARWHAVSSAFFNHEQKERIALRLSKQITKEGFVQMNCTETRSQLENKAIVREKLIVLVNKALVLAKKRKPSRVPRSIIEKRLTSKRKTAEKKQNRGSDFE